MKSEGKMNLGQCLSTFWLPVFLWVVDDDVETIDRHFVRLEVLVG